MKGSTSGQTTAVVVVVAGPRVGRLCTVRRGRRGRSLSHEGKKPHLAVIVGSEELEEVEEAGERPSVEAGEKPSEVADEVPDDEADE